MPRCPCKFPGHQLEHRAADQLMKLVRQGMKVLGGFQPKKPTPCPEQEATLSSLQEELDHIHRVANSYLPRQEQEPPNRMDETAIRAYFRQGGKEHHGG